MWDLPPTVGVLSNLTYHLTVTNMNTGVVIINTTTTDTSYHVSLSLYCTNYKGSVTAYTLEYKSVRTTTVERTPGGECIT